MSDLPDDHAVEALRDLLQHPGWKLLLHHAHANWGHKAVVDRCRTEGVSGRPQLMPQVIAVADAMMEMLAWPVREIERLEREKQKAKAREHEPLVRRRA